MGLFAWQQERPSSPAPPPPCPAASPTGRTRSGQRRTGPVRPAAGGTRAAAAPPGGPPEDPNARAREPGEAARAGRPHRRGVRGRQGQGSGDLGAPHRSGAAYTRLAGVYDEVVVDPCHDRLAAFLDELWTGDVHDVLDIACGTGLLAAELVGRGYRVVGVDASRGDARPGPAPGSGRASQLIRRPLPISGSSGRSTPSSARSTGSPTSSPPSSRPPSPRSRTRLRPDGWLVFDVAHGRDDGLHRF